MTLTKFAYALAALSFGTLVYAGSMPDAAREGCSANHWNDEGAGFAQVRQERLPNAAENSVNPGQNGSIRVHGWANPDVLVKACIQTWAASDSEARDLAGQVKITNGPGHIEASGPPHRRKHGWSVSYEIWMPATSAARLEAFNGSIAVEGIHGRLRLRTLNGSLHLSGTGGDVEGDTTNGSISASVTEAAGGGAGALHLATINGSVNLELPETYSAKVDASTVNGRINVDFPVTVSGEIGKHLSFTLGNGDRQIEAKTTNGSIRISRRA